MVLYRDWTFQFDILEGLGRRRSSPLLTALPALIIPSISIYASALPSYTLHSYSHSQSSEFRRRPQSVPLPLARESNRNPLISLASSSVCLSCLFLPLII